MREYAAGEFRHVVYAYYAYARMLAVRLSRISGYDYALEPETCGLRYALLGTRCGTHLSG